MEKTVPNSQLHKVEVLNDETGDYEAQQNQKTSVKLAFSPYHPKSNRMLKMLKKKMRHRHSVQENSNFG